MICQEGAERGNMVLSGRESNTLSPVLIYTLSDGCRMQARNKVL